MKTLLAIVVALAVSIPAMSQGSVRDLLQERSTASGAVGLICLNDELEAERFAALAVASDEAAYDARVLSGGACFDFRMLGITIPATFLERRFTVPTRRCRRETWRITHPTAIPGVDYFTSVCVTQSAVVSP